VRAQAETLLVLNEVSRRSARSWMWKSCYATRRNRLKRVIDYQILSIICTTKSSTFSAPSGCEARAESQGKMRVAATKDLWARGELREPVLVPMYQG